VIDREDRLRYDHNVLSGTLNFQPTNLLCVQVSTDGLISFGASIADKYTPKPIPTSKPSIPFVSPYWADVDTTINNGRIYYRTVTAGTILRVTQTQYKPA